MNIEEVPYDKVLEIRSKVLYPNQPIELTKVENDHEGIHLGMIDRNEIVGVVSLFLKDRKLQFRKFAILEEFQKKGYGTAIMKWIINYAEEMKLDSVWGNARRSAIEFYDKFDFETDESTAYTSHGVEHVIITYKVKNSFS